MVTNYVAAKKGLLSPQIQPTDEKRGGGAMRSCQRLRGGEIARTPIVP